MLQLIYIDKALGEFIRLMKKMDKFEPSRIIVMSDHNFRFAFHDGENSKHIPLIVKNPYQGKRRDIPERTQVIDVIYKNIR